VAGSIFLSSSSSSWVLEQLPKRTTTEQFTAAHYNSYYNCTFSIYLAAFDLHLNHDGIWQILCGDHGGGSGSALDLQLVLHIARVRSAAITAMLLTIPKFASNELSQEGNSSNIIV
jgi:hypothetical protein